MMQMITTTQALVIIIYPSKLIFNLQERRSAGKCGISEVQGGAEAHDWEYDWELDRPLFKLPTQIRSDIQDQKGRGTDNLEWSHVYDIVSLKFWNAL